MPKILLPRILPLEESGKRAPSNKILNQENIVLLLPIATPRKCLMCRTALCMYNSLGPQGSLCTVAPRSSCVAPGYVFWLLPPWQNRIMSKSTDPQAAPGHEGPATRARARGGRAGPSSRSGGLGGSHSVGHVIRLKGSRRVAPSQREGQGEVTEHLGNSIETRTAHVPAHLGNINER